MRPCSRGPLPKSKSTDPPHVPHYKKRSKTLRSPASDLTSLPSSLALRSTLLPNAPSREPKYQCFPKVNLGETAGRVRPLPVQVDETPPPTSFRRQRTTSALVGRAHIHFDEWIYPLERGGSHHLKSNELGPDPGTPVAKSSPFLPFPSLKPS